MNIYKKSDIPDHLQSFFEPAELGLEQTPEAYIAAMVEVFRAVRDVLADDGTLWVNIGDSYARNPAKGTTGTPNGRNLVEQGYSGGAGVPAGLKEKDLIGIPWMLAFALRADGWYLRQDIIWHKPNPMPESVTDRCTKSHEYLFLLSKGPRYYFDHEAIKELAVGGQPGNIRALKGVEDDPEKHRTRAGLHAYAKRQRSRRDSFKRDDSKRAEAIPGQSVGTHRPDRSESEYALDTRNKRDVWTIATRPYKGAHFATFPPALVEPCILAGSRPGDMVLDPFGGSGTTAGVALKHGRHALMCELNPEYAGLMSDRVRSICDAP